MVVCGITIELGLFAYSNPYEYFLYISYAIISILNILFFCIMLELILKNYLKSLKF